MFVNAEVIDVPSMRLLVLRSGREPHQCHFQREAGASVPLHRDSCLSCLARFSPKVDTTVLPRRQGSRRDAGSSDADS
jgi:hypothetical protein